MKRTDRTRRHLVLQPETHQHMQRGIDQVARAISPTLGPISGTVVVAPTTGTSPEILDDAGLIARRMIQVTNRHEDVGAMFLRGILWSVFEQVNDGVATACVLFKSVFDDGVRQISAGMNAQQLGGGLQDGLGVILEELERMTHQVDAEATLRHVANTVFADNEISSSISDIFAIAGLYTHIEVRESPNNITSYQFINGSFWKSEMHSRFMLTDQANRRIDVERSLVFVSDLDITEDREVEELIRMAKRTSAGGLLIIARSLADSCVNIILQQSDDSFSIVGVRTPDLAPNTHHLVLSDLEVLTGARAFHAAAGDSARTATLERLGKARYVWVDRAYFGIVGAGGDPWKLRHYLRNLKTTFANMDDPTEQERLVARISRLSGSTALLLTSPAKRRVAERTAGAVRSAVLEGVVPGAGTALLACQKALVNAMEHAASPAHCAAYRILYAAVEEPITVMLRNAGKDPASMLSRIQERGLPYCWDGHSDQIVNAFEAGILDPSTVVRVAVRKAVEGAAQALTVDALVHRTRPEVAIHP